MRRSRSARRSVRSAILVRPRWVSQAAVAHSFVPRNVTFKTARHRDPDASQDRRPLRPLENDPLWRAAVYPASNPFTLRCRRRHCQSRHQGPSPPAESSHACLDTAPLSIPISSPPIIPDLPRLCCIMGLRSATPPRILSHARATRNRMFHRAQLCFEQRVLAAQAE